MDIHGYVLVYSITSAKSFEVVQIIYDKLLDITGKVQYVILLFTLLIQIKGLRDSVYNYKCISYIILIEYIFMNFSVPIVLVGNKTDLYVDRMITTEQGKRLADSWHAAFLETSAKQNEVNLLHLF